MAIKKWLGIDGVDFLIHVGATICILAMAGLSNPPEEVFPTIMLGSLVVLGVRRHLALRRRPPETTGEVAAERLADVEDRLSYVEALEGRLVELEERLDFAERLLARKPEVGGNLPAGAPPDAVLGRAPDRR